MPRRKDQVPEDAYQPGNLKLNEEYAQLGVVAADPLAWQFYAALRNDDEMEILLDILNVTIRGHKVKGFEHALWAFKVVVERLKDETPHDRTMLLAIRYVKEAQAKGEKTSGAKLAVFLDDYDIHIDDSYGRRLLRKLVVK